MSQTIVVAFDGSDSAVRAAHHATQQAKVSGAEVLLAHVLEWSAYSFLTPEEVAERHRRRGQEVDRAQSVLDPISAEVRSAGVSCRSMVKYGHVAETLCEIVRSENAGAIVVGRTGTTGLSARIFGSVAGTLAQVAPVPVTIVP